MLEAARAWPILQIIHSSVLVSRSEIPVTVACRTRKIHVRYIEDEQKKHPNESEMKTHEIS